MSANNCRYKCDGKFSLLLIEFVRVLHANDAKPMRFCKQSNAMSNETQLPSRNVCREEERKKMADSL